MKTLLGPGMHDPDRRKPYGLETAHPFPVQTARLLASAPQRVIPVPGHLVAEGRHRSDIAGHGVVSAVTSHHARQPRALLGERLVHASPHLGLDLLQLRSQPFGVGDAPELEAPIPGLATAMPQTQKLARLRLPQTSTLPSLGGEPAELDQPRFARVQLQTELREPAAEVGQEPLGVVPIPKAHDVVVSEPHEDNITACMPSTPLVGSQIEDIVEVDV